MKFFRAKVRLWPLIVVPVVLVGAFIAASVTGLLSPLALGSLISTNTQSRSSEVIKFVLPQQEVALASLHIEGLEREDSKGEILGVALPAANRMTYLEYSFDAKVGIDGSAVRIESQGDHAYAVTIPPFIFIGHSNERFEEPIEANGALSWLTKEVSQSEMTNRILSDEKQDKYIANSRQVLIDQSRAFYSGIIRSVDTEATIEFTFAPGT